MSAYYDLYESPMPGKRENEGEEPVLYARPVGGMTHTTEDIIRIISQECTLTPADLKAALTALSDSVARYLERGDRVQLDGIGSFSISLNCKSVTDAKQVRSHDVSFRHVNMQPAPELTRKLKYMKLYRTPASTQKDKMNREKRLLLLNHKLDREPFVTRKMYRRLTGISEYAVAKELEELVKEGVLECGGTRHSKYYYRKESVTKDGGENGNNPV